MKKSTSVFKIIGIIVLCCSPIIILFFGSYLFLMTPLGRAESALKPSVTYGEFPFEIVYELDGEVVVYKDTYICEYKGAWWNWNQGHFRKWKGYLKSNKKEDIILISDGSKQVICTIGSAEYYMDDQIYSYANTYTPNLILFNTKTGGSSLLSKELMEHYKIKLISWKLSEPIENSFG